MGKVGTTLGLQYTFDKLAKTIVFSGYTINDLEDIAVITDVSNGIVIYNFADGITGTFVYATQTLTLTYNTNTAAFFNVDRLRFDIATEIGQDVTTNSNINTQLNPTNSQYNTPVELVNTTNVAAATTYYPDSTGILLQGMKDFSIQGNTAGGVTTTIEISDEVGTPTRWLDCTKIGFVSGGAKQGSVGNTSFIDEDFKIDFDELNAYRVRIKSVTSDNTNTVYYTLISKGF